MRPLSFFRTLAAVVLLSVSCSKSETVDPTDPNAQLPDPSGTVTLSMRNANSGKTYLGDSYIYIDKADNFAGASFVSLGPVRGLGNVSYIPKTGWASTVAVIPGEGYVAYTGGKFYRIYVTGYTTNVSNEIIGAEVKYQSPFGGMDEAVKVAEKTLTFDSDGDSQDIMFTNESIIPCTVTTEGDCRASLSYVSGYSFLSQGVRIEMDANDQTSERQGKVIIQATNGHTTEIQVMQRALEPKIWLEPAELSLDYLATKESVTIQSNTTVDFNALEWTSSADWCKASSSGQTAWVEVTLNNMGAKRSATLTARSKDGSLSATLSVVQDKFDFTLSQSILDYDRNASKQSVTVFPINCVVTAKSQDTWCTCSVFSNVVEISVAKNTTSQNRSTTVTVSAEGISHIIEVNQSRYAVGDYYNESNVEGVVYLLTSDFHGGIVSMDETQTQWSTEKIETNAIDQDNGLNNMNAIRGIATWSEKYPAFAWCEAKNTNGVTGWYLPAKNELEVVLDNNDLINKGLSSHGGVTLKISSSYYYWSSTQNNSSSAFSVCYWASPSTFYSPISKTNLCYVRAVRAF